MSIKKRFPSPWRRMRAPARCAPTARSPTICTRWKSSCASSRVRGRSGANCASATAERSETDRGRSLGPTGGSGGCRQRWAMRVWRRATALAVEDRLPGHRAFPHPAEEWRPAEERPRWRKGQGRKRGGRANRDALKLARLHRAGELTAVHIPEPTDEALRDLCRARTDAINDQRRTRQQLKAQLLRLGYKYTGKTSWNEAHERYLRELVLPHAAHKIVVEEYLQSIGTAGERVARLTAQIEALAKEWRLWPAVQAVMSLRGFQVLSATLFLSELGRLERFAHPTHLMAYLGLLPSEHSSGDTVRKGAITKCGNSHVRWILIEAAQHYLHPPKVSQELSRRQQGQPRRIKEISWSAQNRRGGGARDKRRPVPFGRAPSPLPGAARPREEPAESDCRRRARTGRLPVGALPGMARAGQPPVAPGSSAKVRRRSAQSGGTHLSPAGHRRNRPARPPSPVVRRACPGGGGFGGNKVPPLTPPRCGHRCLTRRRRGTSASRLLLAQTPSIISTKGAFTTTAPDLLSSSTHARRGLRAAESPGHAQEESQAKPKLTFSIKALLIRPTHEGRLGITRAALRGGR